MIKKEYFRGTGWPYLLIFITYLIISIWIFFTNTENPSLKIGLIGVGVGTFSISVVYLIEFLRGPERLTIKRISDTVNNILKIVENKKAKAPKVIAPSVSIANEIKKLAELKDAGIITEKEFQTKKKELLARI